MGICEGKIPKTRDQPKVDQLHTNGSNTPQNLNDTGNIQNPQNKQQPNHHQQPQPVSVELAQLQNQPVQVYLNNQFPGQNQFYKLIPEHEKILKAVKIQTLKQLAENLSVQIQIFEELQQQQFMLEYDYLSKQKAEPLGQIPVGNDGYTFSFEYQNQDIVKNSKNSKKVLIMGLRRSGKSYFINALANSLLIGYADKFRYHIANYDSNDEIQECNLMEPNANYQFYEVPGYTNSEQGNLQIMNKLYVYLSEQNIKIDIILLCRRNSNSILDKDEKQIILNLVEIFGKEFIKKFQIINTNFDLGQKHLENLERSLKEIPNIYNAIPEPKFIFVNSNTTPKLGEEGNSRFQTVEDAKDNINRILSENQEQLIIRERFIYDHRREIYQNIHNTIEQIKERLKVLQPYLINYFSISQVNGNDETFMVEVVKWATFNPVEVQEQYKVADILENVMLSDAIMNEIKLRAEGSVKQDLPPDQQKRKKGEFVELHRHFHKLQQVKKQYTDEKQMRISEIMTLAQYYRELRQEFLEGTFWQADQPIETLITKNMPDALRFYLQQDQQFEDPRLRDEFEDLRRQLFLPNNSFLATQILGGIL